MVAALSHAVKSEVGTQGELTLGRRLLMETSQGFALVLRVCARVINSYILSHQLDERGIMDFYLACGWVQGKLRTISCLTGGYTANERLLQVPLVID